MSILSIELHRPWDDYIEWNEKFREQLTALNSALNSAESGIRDKVIFLTYLQTKY